ncbi:hypothetical protein HDU92_001675 [Lobulomyces angularis]|nr:hypothetical protein HDU92_001675 [Lobulomyces angularis]
MVSEFITEDTENLRGIQHSPREILIDFASGIAGGSAGILAGHPLDTVKVRLQNSGEYRGVVHCLSRIVKEEGFTGLYKGMASPLIGVALINSLLFGVYGSAIRVFSKDETGNPSLTAIACAGMTSGLINSFFCSPMELSRTNTIFVKLKFSFFLVKIRLQNQRDLTHIPKGYPVYNGPIDCIKKIYASQGIKGYFRGLNSTILRETPSYGAYFASYEFLCRQLIPDGNYDVPSFRLLLAGGFAGVCGWIVTYPFDVIKTRLQSVEQEIKPTYKGVFDCYKKLVAAEGSRVLWSGLGAACVRAFPTNAATFYAVCYVKMLLSPTAPGGSKWERNTPVPEELVEREEERYRCVKIKILSNVKQSFRENKNLEGKKRESLISDGLLQLEYLNKIVNNQFEKKYGPGDESLMKAYLPPLKMYKLLDAETQKQLSDIKPGIVGRLLGRS